MDSSISHEQKDDNAEQQQSSRMSNRVDQNRIVQVVLVEHASCFYLGHILPGMASRGKQEPSAATGSAYCFRSAKLTE